MTTSAPNPRAFQVGPGTWVRLRYSAFDEDGEPVEDGAHEIGYVHGFGVLFSRIEEAVEGTHAQDRRKIELLPHEAFGPRRDEGVLECDPSEFSADVVAGDRLEADTEDGGVVVLRVLEVRPDAVVVDTNHPLAGQRVAIEIDVMEVRPATDEELAAAEQQQEAATKGAGEAAGGPLIPLERLLRTPSQGYETGQSLGTDPESGPADDNES